MRTIRVLINRIIHGLIKLISAYWFVVLLQKPRKPRHASPFFFFAGIIPNPSRIKRRWREDYARAGNSGRSFGNERYEFHLVVPPRLIPSRPLSDENFDGRLRRISRQRSVTSCEGTQKRISLLGTKSFPFLPFPSSFYERHVAW